MTISDFRGYVMDALVTLGRATSRELADAAGLSVHTANRGLRELEDARKIRRVGMDGRNLVWELRRERS